jgi:hypothetical protein
MIALTPLLALLFFQTKSLPIWTEQTFGIGYRVIAPVKLKMDKDTAKAKSHTTEGTWLGDSEACVYSVTYFEYPDAEKPAGLDNLRSFVDSMLGEGKGQVIGARDILLQGWSGLAFTHKTDDGSTLASHVLSDGTRLVCVACGYDTSKPRPPEVDKFLDSLQMPKSGPALKIGIPLTRFPLDDSGISAIFPSAPEKSVSQVGVGSSRGPMPLYTSSFLFQVFRVACRDLPSSVAENLDSDTKDKMFEKIRDDALKNFQIKKSTQKDFKVGKDIGIRVDFTTTDGFTCSLAIYVSGARFFMLFTLQPTFYSTPSTIDDFLHSIEIKS